MGKQQRRKDNSQAASSSKAAQLVHANGVGVPFIGLESSGLGLLDVGQDTPNEFVDLAPEFRILLKKLTKRDSLTREKAVREFAELLKNATSDQLKLSFEYFAPIYQRLVTDANSAIRSASNKLLAEHISRLMKETPNNCLKQTLPFLLFSTADHSKQVVKSATSLLNDCFVAEKKDLVFKNFADDALSLSLNVVNRRHRLFLAPQLFTDEESIEQRRDRLVAQSFNCIDKFAALSSDLPSLLSTLSATFTNSESLNPLIALGNNVKVSLFRLAKKIAQRDPYLLIKGKFITVLLNNLNLSDSSLFQHAFECFLRLAQEDALFEQYSLDKAIVPKLLSLIRKKEGHWDLLADSLLPAFSLIFDRIGPADRKKQCKFAFSVLDSFFDDSVLTIRISPWSNAFVEISKFSLLKLLFDVESENEDEKMEIVTQFFLRVTKFADFVVNDLPVTEYAKLAEFVGWLRQNLTARTEHSKSVAFALDLYSNLEQHLLSLLPKTDFFFVKLLDSTQENGKLAFKLLISSNSSSISNTLLIKAAEALLSSPQANPSEFDALLDIVVLRIRMGYDSVDFDSEIGRLINLLCRILMRTNKSPNSLAQQIKMDNIWICLHSVGFVLSDFCDLLDHNSIFTAFCTIFQSLKRLESKFEQVKHTLELALAYICEKCSDSEREHLLNILPSEAQQIVLMPNTVNFIFAYLVKRRKISVGLQHFFAENIFKTSLETPEFISSSAFLILRQFECDAPKMRRLLRQFLSSKDCTISQIELASNSCNAIAYFTNTTLSELFAPIRSDFIQMAQQMDCLFSAEVLSDDQCLSTVFSLLCANNSPIQLGGNSSSSQNPNDCLLKFAKSALFYCKFLQNASETDRRVVDTSFCYVLVVSTFVNHFKLRTTKMDQSQMLLLFSKEFDTILSIFPSEPSFDQIANAFLNLSQHENECYFSFCAFYSLFKFALLNQQSWQNPFERSPIQTIFEIAFQMRSNANSDVDSVLDLLPHQSAKNAETFAVLRWLTEFEWRCANLTEENRAEHFVALATFIDQHRKEVEDWLFTVRNDKMIQSLFGCVVLKFCAQIVPFLAEVGGPIRDFVNCALITALQNCTESIFTFYDKSKAFDDASMHWMMGHFALILAVRYENCVRMNGANEDYRDIAREWLEFFGPSVANYVFYWFLQFFYINESEKVPPQFFSKSLCNAIQSIDSDRLIKAEIPLEFVQRVTDQCNYDNFPIGQFFEGYSNEKLSKLAPTAVLFFNSNPEIQFAAATILKGFLFEMFSSENTNSSGFGKKSSNCSESEKGADEEDTEGIGQSLARESRQLELPRFFKAVLHFELDNFSRLNESEVDPLLLSWDVLMRFFADLDVLSRVRFCDAIDVKTLSNSLAHLFNSLSDPPGLKGALGAVPRVDDLFVGHFHYKLIDRPFDREHFVSNLFFRTLAVIPALFREWHGSLNKTEAKAVNDYTQKYVSHLLIRRELRSLENMKRGRLEIRILSKVREIECTYRLEETEMNLTILLPENYPIRAPKVETGRSIVSKELHRKWLLQLGVFLNGQNGVMLDGILQWKRSIDNHLQGVEECTICMSTVSSTNFQLPKIRCRQCRKKFHGDCLYKWFQSSSKSSCPLCRANFV